MAKTWKAVAELRRLKKKKVEKELAVQQAETHRLYLATQEVSRLLIDVIRLDRVAAETDDVDGDVEAELHARLRAWLRSYCIMAGTFGGGSMATTTYATADVRRGELSPPWGLDHRIDPYRYDDPPDLYIDTPPRNLPNGALFVKDNRQVFRPPVDDPIAGHRADLLIIDDPTTAPDPGDSPCAPSSPPSPPSPSEPEPSLSPTALRRQRPTDFWKDAVLPPDLQDHQPSPHSYHEATSRYLDPTPSDDSSSETKPDDADSQPSPRRPDSPLSLPHRKPE